MSALRRFSFYCLCSATLAGTIFLSAATPLLAQTDSATVAVPNTTPASTPTPVTPGDALVKSGAILLTSNTIADIAAAALPAVVNIDVAHPWSDRELGMGGSLSPFDFFFNGRRMPGTPNGQNGRPNSPNRRPNDPTSPNGQNEREEQIREHKATGSGFIVRKDGYIVTNAHVVRGATKIKVTLNDKRVFDGTVIGTDGFSDLAVVKINATDLPTVTMGSSTNLRPGEFCVAIGSPQGLDHTVTFGIISAVERAVTDMNGNINYIQTDAAINPGNSGGPLLNLAGEVIGVNAMISAIAQNVGFSIPVDIAKTVANDLIEHKPINRPWLGIAMSEVDPVFLKAIGLPSTTKGVIVGNVMANSPAHVSGLQRNDIIEKIDGTDMKTPKGVQDYVRAHKVQDVLHFLVLRNGASTAVPVKIGQYPDKPVTAQNMGEDD